MYRYQLYFGDDTKCEHQFESGSMECLDLFLTVYGNQEDFYAAIRSYVVKHPDSCLSKRVKFWWDDGEKYYLNCRTIEENDWRQEYKTYEEAIVPICRMKIFQMQGFGRILFWKKEVSNAICKRLPFKKGYVTYSKQSGIGTIEKYFSLGSINIFGTIKTFSMKVGSSIIHSSKLSENILNCVLDIPGHIPRYVDTHPKTYQLLVNEDIAQTGWSYDYSDVAVEKQCTCEDEFLQVIKKIILNGECLYEASFRHHHTASIRHGDSYLGDSLRLENKYKYEDAIIPIMKHLLTTYGNRPYEYPIPFPIYFKIVSFYL